MSALVTAACLWLAGHAVLGLARARRAPAARRGMGPLELHATAWLLGAALLPVLAFYAVWLFGPLSRPAGLALLVLPALAGVPAAVASHRRWRAERAGLAPRHPWSGLERLGGLALAGFALFAVFAAATVPRHGFDSTFHYAYKGKLLFHEGFGTAAWTDLEGRLGRTMTHPSYPPLLPSLELLVAWVRGGWSDDAARPLMALFALAPAALLAAAVRRDARAGRGAALLAALAWLSTPLLYYWRLPVPAAGATGGVAGGLTALFFGPGAGGLRAPAWCLDGTADLPLAAFFLAAFVCGQRLARGAGERVDVVAGGLAAAGALLVKNEGLVLVLVLAGVLTLGRWTRARAPAGRGSGRALLAAGALAAVVCAGWLVARAGLPVVDEDYAGRLSAGQVAGSLDRVGEVALRFARTLVDASMWNLTWPLLAAAAAWGLSQRRVAPGGPAGAALLVVGAATAGYACVLLVTPWDLAVLETTGIPMRLLLHVAPVALFATYALACGPGDEAHSRSVASSSGSSS